MPREAASSAALFIVLIALDFHGGSHQTKDTKGCTPVSLRPRKGLETVWGLVSCVLCARLAPQSCRSPCRQPSQTKKKLQRKERDSGCSCQCSLASHVKSCCILLKNSPRKARTTGPRGRSRLPLGRLSLEACLHHDMSQVLSQLRIDAGPEAVTLLGDHQTEADWCVDRPIFVLLTVKRLQSVCSPRLSGREPHGLRHVDVALESSSQLRACDKTKPCHTCYAHTWDHVGQPRPHFSP